MVAQASAGAISCSNTHIGLLNVSSKFAKAAGTCGSLKDVNEGLQPSLRS